MFEQIGNSSARVLLCAATLFCMVGVASAAGTPEASALPEGKGRETLIRLCSECHEADLVIGQQHDKDGWRFLVDRMVVNGTQGTDEELAEIVEYLAANVK